MIAQSLKIVTNSQITQMLNFRHNAVVSILVPVQLDETETTKILLPDPSVDGEPTLDRHSRRHFSMSSWLSPMIGRYWLDLRSQSSLIVHGPP